jgi:alpha-D-ribose 1-methylphosphonate 5-triphosphate synthase subunit PhnG
MTISANSATPLTQSDLLSILARTPADALKAFAESLLDSTGTPDVLLNRTGLIMLPYTDNAQGTIFHLGEVLVAEAQVRLPDGTEGYGMCTGRDLVQALGIALIDAAMQSGIQTEAIIAFAREQHAGQQADDEMLLRQVETTRVEMETF